MGAFNDAVLTVQRRRTGGKQVVQVIHQQVAVAPGGKAIVAAEVKGGRKGRVSLGVEVKSGDRPYKPDWRRALACAQGAPRCRARCRHTKLPCRGPAMRGRPVCRLHGGKGGGPLGERNGAYRTGRYTAKAKAERRQMRTLIRRLQQLIDSTE